MRAAIILATVLAASSARAEFYDGNMLLQRLTGDDIEKMAAYGYLAGVHDSMRGLTHCSPDNITLRQVSDMALQWLTMIPQHRHKPADQLIAKMLAQVWPCAEPKPGAGA